MTGYCFDTDILSATIRPAPPLHLIRRLATVAPQEQFTTSVTVGELIYGAGRVGREELSRRVAGHVRGARRAVGGVSRFGRLSSTWYTPTLPLPRRVEFLWNYIQLTPLGPLVADGPEEERAAMERQVVEAWTPSFVNGRIPVEQPMALAWGVRS